MDAAEFRLVITFKTKSLRSLCVKAAIAHNAFGAEVARWLQSRVADLRAADVISQIVVGLRPEAEGSQGELRRIDLIEGYQIVLKAGQQQPPLLNDGRVDWNRVWRVQILDIEKVAN